MFLFCYHTSDPHWIELAHRYWAVDENGKYVESAQTLLSQSGAASTAQQTALLAQHATAHDTNKRYSCCGKPLQLRSRTNHSSFLQLCTSCQMDRAERDRVKASLARQQHDQALRNFAERNANKIFNYLEAPDDIAVLVLALNRALGGRYFQISFKSELCSSLCSTGLDSLLTRLLDQGALIHCPLKAPANAYEFEGGKIRYYYSRVVFEATPSAHDDIDIISCLENRPFINGAVLTPLWLEYAAGECMAYFLDLTRMHGLETEMQEEEKVLNTVRTALERYSISNLWSAIWKVIQDAAALSTTQYYNNRRAAATLPNKLRNHLATVEAGKKRLGIWKRTSKQPLPALGHVFHQIFGVDENTPGEDVVKQFAALAPSEHLESPVFDRETISDILRQALTQDIAPEVLSTFAATIKSGGSMDEALYAVIVGHDLPY